MLAQLCRPKRKNGDRRRPIQPKWRWKKRRRRGIVSWCSYNTAIVSLNTTPITIKTPLVRKAMMNHLIISMSLEKAQRPLSGSCYARNRVGNAAGEGRTCGFKAQSRDQSKGIQMRTLVSRPLHNNASLKFAMSCCSKQEQPIEARAGMGKRPAGHMRPFECFFVFVFFV